MAALGYDGELKANQPFEVAEKMKWLVAALYTFSAIVMFVAITFIYNLDKKKVAVMTAELNERRGIAPTETEATETVEEVVEETQTLEKDVAQAEEVIEEVTQELADEAQEVAEDTIEDDATANEIVEEVTENEESPVEETTEE
jgi:hypothetical protein